MNKVALKYHHRQPPTQPPSARLRALDRWFSDAHMATLGLLFAVHPRYPVVRGGRHG